MTIDTAAHIIWNYMLMGHEVKKADAILVLCSADTSAADRAAELYKQGYADTIIFSGGFGRVTKHTFQKPEAETFAERLVNLGIPKQAMILENKSTNTGENIRYTYKLLMKLRHKFQRLIIVQKPYMERRTYATFKKEWPDIHTEVCITSLQVPYESYFDSKEHKDRVIHHLVGDLQRIKEYPKLGFQIQQKIPENVWAAYEYLTKHGFTDQLIKKSS